MVKRSRKKLGLKKRNSKSRISKKMVGGSFTDEEKKDLLDKGFSLQDIDILANIPVGINMIKSVLLQTNPQTGNKFTPSEIIGSISDMRNEINNIDITDENNRVGGKKRKTMKRRKRSRMKSKTQRGGICFGNGVGANNYDPNFSIYNTRELTLFPYKPTN